MVTSQKSKVKSQKSEAGDQRSEAARPEFGAEAGETQVVEASLDTVTVTVPIVELRTKEYVRPHIDLQLDRRRAETLKRITDGLVLSRASLSDGRPVTTPADAIRWWLDGVRTANENAD